MNPTKTVITTVLATALVPWIASDAQSAIVRAIDPLSTVQSVGRQTPGTTTNNKPNLSGTIFSNNALNTNITRRIILQQTSGQGQSLFVIPDPNLGAGISFSNNTNVNTAATIQYRGTLSGGKFSPVDLTVGGLADRVTVGIILNDLPLGQSTTFRLTLGSGTTTSTNTVVFNLDYNKPNRPFPVEFPFDTFTGIVPTAINSFSLAIDPPANGDVGIKILGVSDAARIQTTPEPTTILGLLTVAGIASTLGRNHRHRR